MTEYVSKPSLPEITSMIDLILLIEQRPPMYLGGNSLMRLRSFLDGWTFRELLERPEKKDSDRNVLQDFATWLQKAYDVPYFPWDKLIALHAVDDAHALTLLFQLFHQFLEER